MYVQKHILNYRVIHKDVFFFGMNCSKLGMRVGTAKEVSINSNEISKTMY